MPRAIVFDFNGVLADDEEVHFLMFQRVLGEERILLTREKYYEEYLGYDDRGCFRAACLAAGRTLSDGDLADLIGRKSAYYTAHVAGHDVLYPGAAEAVWRMSGRYALAVVSGALRNEIDGILGRAGIRNLFRVVVAAEDVSAGKPDPEGFVRALAEMNEKQTGARPLRPEECLVIEDSHAGIEAARRAGMPVLAVAHTYPAESLRDADDVIPSIADLTADVAERLTGRNA
ncbi:MAG: HAD family phosphatase [Nitrospirae bacterium]|nr:HAD family phosphatase [Nitrospirota bacterium]MBI3392495.1 HAD family phosphatase [Nitrospirota bacterium]